MKKTIETVKNALPAVLAGMMLFFMFVLMWMCILTPEKTPAGNYTQPVKYWTDSQYFYQEFGCATDAECEAFGILNESDED